jgi:hypothetical protein
MHSGCPDAPGTSVQGPVQHHTLRSMQHSITAARALVDRHTQGMDKLVKELGDMLREQGLILAGAIPDDPIMASVR